MFRQDDRLSVDEKRRLTVTDADERGVIFRRAENLIPTDCVEGIRKVNFEEGLSRTEVVDVTAGGINRSLSSLFNFKTVLQRSQLLGDTITNYRTCRLSNQATQRAADSYWSDATVFFTESAQRRSAEDRAHSSRNTATQANIDELG